MEISHSQRLEAFTRMAGMGSCRSELASLASKTMRLGRSWQQTTSKWRKSSKILLSTHCLPWYTLVSGGEKRLERLPRIELVERTLQEKDEAPVRAFGPKIMAF